MDANTAEAERLFSLLQMAAGEDADRDLYYDETAGAWDLEGLRSDLAVYSPQAAAVPTSQPAVSMAPPSPAVAAPAAPAATPQAAPPQTSAPPQLHVQAPPPQQQQVWAPPAPAQSPQPASGLGAAPPPTHAAASPAPFQSPEPTFEQMMASATPLNVAAPTTAAPPAPLSPPFGSGGSMAPPASRDSSTSWQTVGAGLMSPPACGVEGEATAESEEKPAQPQGQGGWLVNLVEGGQMPSFSGLTSGLSSWVGGFQQRTEAAPRAEEPSYVYNAEIGVSAPPPHFRPRAQYRGLPAPSPPPSPHTPRPASCHAL